ncbi:DUF2163 domain-containing protein [Polymorphobacter sp. PAMC 29334]|uniref:DUF2163 domain-containing protein n=1 Tax=Polymorphobacter sp. PAMC 29334 TaxID=2862331 RepID=UPI001C67BF6A|nr:DUF2163 domain-containing protein [Polymorphobacter sp. PAMC 29334]QYE33701.1 DUF2163 domain-containing protein [Polymorphobacter sp. PAMC 29334]
MAFSDSLARDLTTIALCWRVARSDGVVLGFTTHDRPLDIGGLRYAAAPGMTPSAISLGDGLEVDTMEFAGALSAAAITGEDLAAGRYDAAALTVFMADWDDPAAGTLRLAGGTIGAIEQRTGPGGGSFTATVRGPTAAFEAIAIETCSPDCRAELGDRRCRVDLAPLTAIARTNASTRDRIGVAVIAIERFAEGRVRPLEGPNAGLDARIAGVDGDALLLFEALPFAVAAGTRVELREGCDKTLATCSARFANAINFRGEPHVPGGDVLTRFPGV